MKYKLYFPTGYRNDNVHNDNVDLYIIREDSAVYVVTLFTIDNIKSLMQRLGESWFWATDMVVVKDLKMQTIKEAAAGIVSECLDTATTKIGDLNSVFAESEYYAVLNDWSVGAPDVVSRLMPD